MTDTDTQLFHLLDPSGKEIMSGPMSIIMEHLPDTRARNAALDEAVHAAVEAAEAEERLENARTATAQIITDGITRLSGRLDAYVERLEEQRKADAEEAEREEQEQIQAKLDALPDPDDPDPSHGDVDGDDELTIRHAPNDADPDPTPLRATSAPGATHEPGPDPGTIEYPPHQQIASPTAISLNEA